MKFSQTRDSWDFLLTYQSFELVKTEYKKRHGREANTRHSREVSASFGHARAYFSAAAASDLGVKPLLLYYGVASLSRGLTLLLTRSLRENALEASHGLSVGDWRGELSRDNPDFGNLSVSVNGNGSFYALSRATKHKSLLHHNTSAVNFVLPGVEPRSGTKYFLGDLLARIPQLHHHHFQWKGVVAAAEIESFQILSDEKLEFRLHNRAPLSPSIALELCEQSGFSISHQDDKIIHLSGPNSLQVMPGITDKPGSFSIPNIWVVKRYPDAENLSQITTLFVVSFILGMIVRYYPMQWTALLQGQFADAALPTLLTSVAHVENAFPALAVDFIREQPPSKTG